MIRHKFIPEDEIWIKFGGDHGGGSFKMCYQIMNVISPNAVHNVVPFCMFAAKDRRENLEIGLDRFRKPIQQLDSGTWM